MRSTNGPESTSPSSQPLEYVTAVTVPTLVAQVHDDTMTRPQDVRDIYDAIAVEEKSPY
ncbi:MAG: uncharacterized protein QOK02_2407 [Mycobacterium sp.]|nr:uncharacterized protein [Mycobacterium sp.]